MDIDNDGDEDLYETVSSDVDILHINNNGRLTDETLAHGIDRITGLSGRQALFFDYNGDGRLDLFSLSISGPALFAQLADGTFGNHRALACDGDAEWGHFADIDAAKGMEFICAERSGTYPKVNNFDKGKITDLTLQYPALSPVNDAVQFDYNGDLKPDLFLVRSSEKPSDAYQYDANHFEAQLITAANKIKSVKFKSKGVLTLTVSTRAGIDPQGDPKNINIGNVDWSPTSLQFNLDPTDKRNAGIGTGASGINVGYLTSTGEWEITQSYTLYDYSYVQVASTSEITGLTFIGSSGSDIGYKPYLMTNTGHSLAQDSQSGLNVVMRCSSAVAGDFDNDMDEDLYVTCTGGAHNTANRLFINDGKGKFTEVPNAAGAAGIQGAAVGQHAGTADVVVSADYDLDGFLDLLVMNGSNMRPVYEGGPKQLFHNLGNGNHWVEFDLVGTTSNRDGMGSKVYVTSGGKTQYREQNGGYHRWSQNFSRVHVGLAGNTQADVTVVWPNGLSKTYPGIPANHVYQLKQDGTRTQIH